MNYFPNVDQDHQLNQEPSLSYFYEYDQPPENKYGALKVKSILSQTIDTFLQNGELEKIIEFSRSTGSQETTLPYGNTKKQGRMKLRRPNRQSNLIAENNLNNNQTNSNSQKIKKNKKKSNKKNITKKKVTLPQKQTNKKQDFQNDEQLGQYQKDHVSAIVHTQLDNKNEQQQEKRNDNDLVPNQIQNSNLIAENNQNNNQSNKKNITKKKATLPQKQTNKKQDFQNDEQLGQYQKDHVSAIVHTQLDNKNEQQQEKRNDNDLVPNQIQNSNLIAENNQNNNQSNKKNITKKKATLAQKQTNKKQDFQNDEQLGQYQKDTQLDNKNTQQQEKRNDKPKKIQNSRKHESDIFVTNDYRPQNQENSSKQGKIKYNHNFLQSFIKNFIKKSELSNDEGVKWLICLGKKNQRGRNISYQKWNIKQLRVDYPETIPLALQFLNSDYQYKNDQIIYSKLKELLLKGK